jgi:hypothetical protein
MHVSGVGVLSVAAFKILISPNYTLVISTVNDIFIVLNRIIFKKRFAEMNVRHFNIMNRMLLF